MSTSRNLLDLAGWVEDIGEYPQKAVAWGLRRYTGNFRGKFANVRGKRRNRAIIADHFRRGNRQRYWPGKPLSPEYARWKAARYPGQPDMVLTGAMGKSIIGKARVDVRAGTFQVTFPRAVRYAQYQIEAGRDMILPDDRDMQKIRRAAREWVREEMKRRRQRSKARRKARSATR